MSENEPASLGTTLPQAPPSPTTTVSSILSHASNASLYPSSAVDLQLQQESLATNGIEKRQRLSPVSPRPVHLAEPPVLKNQMELAINYSDAHTSSSPVPPETANGAASVNQASLEALMQQQKLLLQQQQQHCSSPPSHAQQHQPSTSPPPQNPSQDALTVPQMLYPVMDGSSHFNQVGHGEVSAGNGSVESPSAQTNGAAVVPAKPANSATITTATVGLPKPPTVPNNLPSTVDLQALLTKLAPSATPTVPQHLPSASHTPQPNGTSATTTSSAPPSVQAPASQSPVQTRTQTLPPSLPSLPQPTNHPLPPVPVVSSSVPGHPAAGYPASLPPPPNFAQHKQQQANSASEDEDEEDSRPFTAEEEEAFTKFLQDERDYVTQGQWDRFPNGSRLFIGNLPTEKVTKRDLFRLFIKHGRLAQISIKQAYGFVQFLTSESCAAALRHEQGSSVRGRKMHLEISKPQRNTGSSARTSTEASSARTRRSRSPDYNRGAPREVDRYRGPPPSDRELRDRRDRDDYGSRRRSPPPRSRDDYRPGRRSRSRSPPARYRQRSRSRSPEDDVPLPRRAPDQVPEVQILVCDELDRNFIWWVENAFKVRHLKVDMLFLNPRLQMSSVVKRQVLEGVQAVVFLNRQMQTASKISIQVFDRRDEGEALYSQYDNLDPSIAAELVFQAKASQQQHIQAQQARQQPPPVPPPVAQYGYGAPPAAPPAQPTPQALTSLAALAAIPGIASVFGNLDPASLQALLASLNQQQQPQPQTQARFAPPPQPQLGADLAALLAGRPAVPPPQQPQQQYQPPPPPPQHQQMNNGLSAFGGQAGLAALLGQASQKLASQQQQQQQQQHQQQHEQQGMGNEQQMQQQPNPAQIGNIMETLAKWKQA
ncbi:hypothetical protein BZA77DRAFT_309807 [Pyronema omphalodes]|nr:hypothetical protein BZA77DRAFT_309807 [Pyronema omphalodes]